MKNTICLIMIVKNESKIINRLLNSLLKVIDFISVVDTGSIDDTKILIEKWGKQNKIPTKVHNTLFKNFSYNRQDSFLKGKECYPQANYFLLSDADHIWEVDKNFNKFWLMDDAYKVVEKSPNLEHSNLRLIKSNCNWECLGVTHEYWQKTGNIIEDYKLLKTIRILDQHDGGSKNDKFIRDEKLLRDGLNTEKKNNLIARYSFYLSETLKNTEQYEEAIKTYRKCFRNKNWNGEIYCSHLYILYCSKILSINYYKEGDKNKAYEYAQLAFEHAFYAYEKDTSRIESLYYISELYIEIDMDDQANNILKKIHNCEIPRNKLFVEIGKYGLFLKYLAWNASIYSKDKETQLLLTEDILTNFEEVEHINENVKKFSYLCNPMI